jgi:hypothetical protein
LKISLYLFLVSLEINNFLTALEGFLINFFNNFFNIFLKILVILLIVF